MGERGLDSRRSGACGT